jgi:hypothetical protein
MSLTTLLTYKTYCGIMCISKKGGYHFTDREIRLINLTDLNAQEITKYRRDVV